MKLKVKKLVLYVVKRELLIIMNLGLFHCVKSVEINKERGHYDIY
jgi:hypothetical protein